MIAQVELMQKKKRDAEEIIVNVRKLTPQMRWFLQGMATAFEVSDADEEADST